MSRDYRATPLLVAIATLAATLGCDSETKPDPASEPDVVEDSYDLPGEPCFPEVPEAATLQAGEVEGETVISLGGQAVAAPGTTIEVDGFPASAAIHPNNRFGYVISTSNDDRKLYVVDLAEGLIAQALELEDAFYGIVLSPDGSTLYVSGGPTRRVDAYDVNAESGEVALRAGVDVGIFTSGLDVSPDGAKLFVGSITTPRVTVFDTASIGAEGLEPLAEFRTATANLDVHYVRGIDAIAVGTLGEAVFQVLDAESGEERARFDLPQSPMDSTSSVDGSRIYVAVAGPDEVVAIDTSRWEIVGRTTVAEDDLVDGEGRTLGRSNTNSISRSPDGEQLFVTRGSDNAISVVSASDLTVQGALPTGWYPAGSAISPDGTTLLIAEGKGFGAGPSEGRSSKNQLDGNISIVALPDLDLEATTAMVIEQFNRPRTVFPFECDDDGFFPIPTRPGQETPIEHVILIVKENKTFDCVFGDLTDMDVDVDPSLVRWGERITPNQHAIAREFAFAANFYDEVEDSDTGHIRLTTGFLTEYVERIWVESDRNLLNIGYQVLEEATPHDGNLFTHLIDHGISIRVYGEIVGMFAEASDGSVPMDFSDQNYPGGPFYNMGARDTSRAEYVLERIEEGDFAQFTFMLLPNDHTGGTTPGNPTPEAQVADNDFAVGLLADGLSRTEYWEKTAIFVVQDDTQGCTDHVDAHRAFAMVISPWARRQYVSHVNYNFMSVFATIQRILGVPPMGRPDASASPMWDMFWPIPDLSPFEVRERQVPEQKNAADAPGAEKSMRMDFRGPDRNEELGVVLDNYRLWRMGRITREEAESRIERGVRSVPADLASDALRAEHMEELAEEAEEEAEEELTAFDADWRRYEAWLRDRGLPVPQLESGPMDDDTIQRVLSGEISPEQLSDRFVPQLPPNAPTPAVAPGAEVTPGVEVAPSAE